MRMLSGEPMITHAHAHKHKHTVTRIFEKCDWKHYNIQQYFLFKNTMKAFVHATLNILSNYFKCLFKVITLFSCLSPHLHEICETAMVHCFSVRIIMNSLLPERAVWAITHINVNSVFRVPKIKEINLLGSPLIWTNTYKTISTRCLCFQFPPLVSCHSKANNFLHIKKLSAALACKLKHFFNKCQSC